MAPRDMFTGNTTIGAIITNAAFNKAELNKIASMARNAYARCINPVGTMADGDTIYAASTANEATVKLYMLISTSQEHLLPALCPLQLRML